MEKKFVLQAVNVLFISCILASPIYSQNPYQSVINVNNITSWVGNDGFHHWVVDGSYNGAFPKGSSMGVIFTEGTMWGGRVTDNNTEKIRVNGSMFGTGNKAVTRLFRVKPAYKEEDLRDDAINFFNISPKELDDSLVRKIYDQYEKDWNEWPADKGAPYFDNNNNGKYEPHFDIPGIPGASQTIWINYNDGSSDSLLGSPPIGLEIRETYWAYGPDEKPPNLFNRTLSNVIFKQALIVYKGNEYTDKDSHIDDMYIAQWADPDIFTSSDDLSGCDTLLSLGYTYDAPSDRFITNAAAGYLMLQGPAYRSPNSSDSALINFKWRYGYKYFNDKPLLNFISFSPFSFEGDWLPDPWIEYYYNWMRGYNPFGDTSSIYRGHGTYMYSGDPVTGSGWLDVEPPGDRRIMLVTGPVTMKPGDTVEVVVALVAGLGPDNLSAVTDLKRRSEQTIMLYNEFIDRMTKDNLVEHTTLSPAGSYVLYPNYPNPFNSSTVIRYELPEAAQVRLAVYDILGREVERLVDEKKEKGNYEIVFNADGLASGVYFYRISFDNVSNKLMYDNLVKTSKLILIK